MWLVAQWRFESRSRELIQWQGTFDCVHPLLILWQLFTFSHLVVRRALVHMCGEGGGASVYWSTSTIVPLAHALVHVYCWPIYCRPYIATHALQPMHYSPYTDAHTHSPVHWRFERDWHHSPLKPLPFGKEANLFYSGAAADNSRRRSPH